MRLIWTDGDYRTSYERAKLAIAQGRSRPVVGKAAKETAQRVREERELQEAVERAREAKR